ncbi:MAG: homoserine kinase [Gammaproteobacteria bacterium]|nr:homoserine kinase [Gammaproteobacteria bacterium]
MSVYTPITAADLGRLWQRYDLPPLSCFTPIADGIENSNFLLTTAAGPYVLTLIERLDAAYLPDIVAILGRLKRAGLVVPQPLADRQGETVQQLAGKPALLFSHLEGASLTSVTAAHCYQVGEALAQIHLALATVPSRRDTFLGLPWQVALPQLPVGLTPVQRQLLTKEMAQQQPLAIAYAVLPQGILHGDLFRDNALFIHDNLAALLDFYTVGSGAWIYDLAVAANDWCGGEAGVLLPHLLEALLAGYQTVRRLTADEWLAWHGQLRAAALRFYLARLTQAQSPRQGVLVAPRNASHFAARLAWLQSEAAWQALARFVHS